MQSTDLNLLPVVQALLQEQSVTRASARLHLSVPATSRALERCRRLFEDPLLVRSGRQLVITPRGSAILRRLDPLLGDIDLLLEREQPVDPSKLRTTFVILANEVVISALGGALIRLLGREAPFVELRFTLESPDDLQMLRDGHAALAIGSYGGLSADLQTETLATEHMVSVMRAGHPLAGRRVTSARFAALEHIVTSRRGIARGPIDDALALQGRERRIAAVVPSFSAALALCMDSDLVTIAPRRLARRLAGPSGLVEFRSPVELPTVEVDIVWHARVDADPIHRWLRTCIRRVAAEPTRPVTTAIA